MKKFLKVLLAIVLAVALVGGGYYAGQRNGLSSIISAMPKRTVEKQPDGEPAKEGIKPDESLPPVLEAPSADEVAGVEDRAIALSDTSAVDESWSQVSSSENTESGETLTLYTSAEKDGDEFLWDDSNKWVLELSDGKGGYYTLYDQRVTNGSVYFDVVERDNGDKLVYLYTITGAGVSVNQYTRTDTGFTEKNVFNSGAVNRTFTSVPQY